MIGFHRLDAALACDGVPLADIARGAGTPVYVYSAAVAAARYRALDAAFDGYPHALHYALKANSTLAIVRLLRGLGAAADANSGGEIELALRAGFIPRDIVFTGVGKTLDELERAITLGVKAINAESRGEIERIACIARAQGTTARVAVRMNPDIDARSHPHISTGLRVNKFGVPIDEAVALSLTASRTPGLAVVGVHVHIGSQITSLDPIVRAASAAVAAAADLRRAGVGIEHVDLGGGLGISYDEQGGSAAPTIGEYAEAVLGVMRGSGFDLLLEPGRSVIGPAGALLTRVVDVKPQPDGKWFVVVDAGMTELLRPALYRAYHRIVPLAESPGPESLCDIVGPVCETSDTLGFDRRLGLPAVGEYLAVLDAGAYGSVMASNYNRRPLPAEVLVEGGRWRIIRRRQTIDDLLAAES